jgi:hypothetical protein
VTSILANPRYTGRQVRNRRRTDKDLVDPANTGLGHKPVQRSNLPLGGSSDSADLSGPSGPPAQIRALSRLS